MYNQSIHAHHTRYIIYKSYLRTYVYSVEFESKPSRQRCRPDSCHRISANTNSMLTDLIPDLLVTCLSGCSRRFSLVSCSERCTAARHVVVARFEYHSSRSRLPFACWGRSQLLLSLVVSPLGPNPVTAATRSHASSCLLGPKPVFVVTRYVEAESSCRRLSSAWGQSLSHITIRCCLSSFVVVALHTVPHCIR